MILSGAFSVKGAEKRLEHTRGRIFCVLLRGYALLICKLSAAPPPRKIITKSLAHGRILAVFRHLAFVTKAHSRRFSSPLRRDPFRVGNKNGSCVLLRGYALPICKLLPAALSQKIIPKSFILGRILAVSRHLAVVTKARCRRISSPRCRNKSAFFAALRLP